MTDGQAIVQEIDSVDVHETSYQCNRFNESENNFYCPTSKTYEEVGCGSVKVIESCDRLDIKADEFENEIGKDSCLQAAGEDVKVSRVKAVTLKVPDTEQLEGKVVADMEWTEGTLTDEYDCIDELQTAGENVAVNRVVTVTLKVTDTEQLVGNVASDIGRTEGTFADEIDRIDEEPVVMSNLFIPGDETRIPADTFGIENSSEDVWNRADFPAESDCELEVGEKLYHVYGTVSYVAEHGVVEVVDADDEQMKMRPVNTDGLALTDPLLQNWKKRRRV